MKQEIIEQMYNELYPTRLCKQDFEKYDFKTLQNIDEPFFWMVREHGTSLCCIGVSQLLKWFGNEQSRFMLMQDNTTAIQSILYWNDSTAKYFYYDGWRLHRVPKDDVKEIFMNVCGVAIKQMIAEHPEEAMVANQPLKLEICESARNALEEAKALANDLHDSSLKNCLKDLTLYRRIAIDHVIQIYGDFTKHSFGFSEYVNGKVRLSGGIIYSEYSENHWSIHT